MAQKHQHGFGIIVIVVLLLVVAALGVTSYLILQAPQKPKASTQTTASTPHYLVIKEWGVKLPLSADFSYTMTADGAIIRDKREDADAKAIQCNLAEAQAGFIRRTTSVDLGPGFYSPLVDGHYYLLYLSGQAACTDAPGYNTLTDRVNQQAETDATILKNAIKQVAAD